MTDRDKRFEYRLRLADGSRCAITIVIDATSLLCREPAPAAHDWTALDCHRCPHCPLDGTSDTLCPLAARLGPVVEILGPVLSHQTVDAEVEADGRTVTANTSAQAVASSIIGLISATSGCPHTDFLRPLAWFHQPFASEQETVFRSVSAWLLKQYFRRQDGGTPDWDLNELCDRYTALHTINVHLAKRLRQASTHDATVNAIVRLDMFTKAVPEEVGEILGSVRACLR
ncbi:MAG: hypothetical protein L6Q60_09390 [Rhodocyclaceae bacterium]|nr:hypothetical protein [Rhodocyclaceae bacterium]